MVAAGNVCGCVDHEMGGGFTLPIEGLYITNGCGCTLPFVAAIMRPPGGPGREPVAADTLEPALISDNG
jgi:hypothetical protein